MFQILKKPSLLSATSASAPLSTLPAPHVRPPITGLLVDISGNLHVGSNPTPNAVEAFKTLKNSSMPFRLCSNSSKESTASLVKRLECMGFEIQVESASTGSRRVVWTSIGAVSRLISNMGLKSPYLLLSSSAKQEISQRPDEDGISNYDSVVVGLDPGSLDYNHLNQAFRILKGETQIRVQSSPPAAQHFTSNPGDVGPFYREVPLIATHKAKYFQTESGLALGPGPFVAALEDATGIKAQVVGKPTKSFFKMVIDNFSQEEIPDHSLGRVAVIGDDVEADLGEGAIELQFWRVLVKTGKYRMGDEKREGIMPPDEVFESFAEFVDSLLSGS